MPANQKRERDAKDEGKWRLLEKFIPSLLRHSCSVAGWEILRQNSAIVISLHHPSGDPTPSKADIEMTRTIASIGAQMGIVGHDHIIICKNGHASLKGLKLY